MESLDELERMEELRRKESVKKEYRSFLPLRLFTWAFAAVIGIGCPLSFYVPYRFEKKFKENLDNTRYTEGIIAKVENASFPIAWKTGNHQFSYSKITLDNGKKIIIPYQSPDFQKGKTINLTYTPDLNKDGMADFVEILTCGHSRGFQYLKPMQNGRTEADGIVSYRTLDKILVRS